MFEFNAAILDIILDGPRIAAMLGESDGSHFIVTHGEADGSLPCAQDVEDILRRNGLQDEEDLLVLCCYPRAVKKTWGVETLGDWDEPSRVLLSQQYMEDVARKLRQGPVKTTVQYGPASQLS